MRSAIMGAVLALGACTSANGGENGEARASGERSFDVGAFEAVSLEGAHDVVVTVGGAPSVRAEGDAEALQRLDIRVEGNSLRIGTRRDGWLNSGRHRGVTVHVTTPALSGASVGGSGDMRIDRVEAEAFDASIAGSGDMAIAALQARRADFDIAGSGTITAAGSVEQASVSIAGSGDARLDELQARHASVSIAGSGDIAVRATESVDGSILGSGNVIVQGNARCSVSKMGSGSLRCGS